MKLKTGDNVMIRRGKDRGKTGKITQVFPEHNRVVVEGLNIRTRHLRPQRSGEKGQAVEFSAPLAEANVALVCGKCGQVTRLGFQVVIEPSGTKKKLRVCKKCHETIE